MKLINSSETEQATKDLDLSFEARILTSLTAFIVLVVTIL